MSEAKKKLNWAFSKILRDAAFLKAFLRLQQNKPVNLVIISNFKIIFPQSTSENPSKRFPSHEPDGPVLSGFRKLPNLDHELNVSENLTFSCMFNYVDQMTRRAPLSWHFFLESSWSNKSELVVSLFWAFLFKWVCFTSRETTTTTLEMMSQLFLILWRPLGSLNSEIQHHVRST